MWNFSETKNYTYLYIYIYVYIYIFSFQSFLINVVPWWLSYSNYHAFDAFAMLNCYSHANKAHCCCCWVKTDHTNMSYVGVLSRHKNLSRTRKHFPSLDITISGCCVAIKIRNCTVWLVPSLRANILKPDEFIWNGFHHMKGKEIESLAPRCEKLRFHSPENLNAQFTVIDLAAFLKKFYLMHHFKCLVTD